MTYGEAYKLAQKYNETLLCTDPRLHNAVHVFVDDGSTFMWQNAFLMSKDDYIIIFTEHHGFHVYHKDDVEYMQFQRMYDKVEELL